MPSQAQQRASAVDHLPEPLQRAGARGVSSFPTCERRTILPWDQGLRKQHARMLRRKHAKVQSKGHSASAATDTGEVMARLFQHSVLGKKALPVAFYIGGHG